MEATAAVERAYEHYFEAGRVLKAIETEDLELQLAVGHVRTLLASPKLEAAFERARKQARKSGAVL